MDLPPDPVRSEGSPDNLDYSNSDDSDFQIPLPVPDDNGNKRRMEESDSQEDDQDTTVCSICQKEWTNNGYHSIVQMKCGHCFGKFCINEYKRDKSKNSTFNCPLCGQLTKKRELRKIWPSKLIPENQAYLDELTLELKELDQRLAQLATQNADIQKEMAERKVILNSFDSLQVVVPSQATSQEMVDSQTPQKFTLKSTVSSRGEFYHAVDLNPLEDMAVVSTLQRATGRYGFRKINMYDPSVTEFIPTNHQNAIRDIKHSPNGMLLSTGDDKTLKLTSITKNLVVQSYTLEAPSRTCALDDENPNLLYCGLTTGALMVYDVRNTRSYLSKLVDPERNGSLLSVIPHGNSILCTDQYASYTWELDESQQYITQPLHFQNQVQDKDTKENIYSVSMTKNTFVTSKRIGRRMEHYVNNITNENGQRVFSEAWSCAVFQVIPSFCRNAHFTRDDDVFLCYAEEDKVTIQTKDGQAQAFATDAPVVDIRHTSNSVNEFLATLSNEALCIYTCNVKNTQ
ncbi:hypothetical protein FB192DRAFT_1382316 [Mucor lusitanicus]|uniref:RING-type domain-containing protein n=1 Tax=Mucor circinelloides f. lusitanicus TaxID=29924 RepID=A0A8H4BEG9_MUCCL|nr:hypothetical protein FB192DRAFT_1382316 [Mucor lusitanicus]